MRKKNYSMSIDTYNASNEQRFEGVHGRNTVTVWIPYECQRKGKLIKEIVETHLKLELTHCNFLFKFIGNLFCLFATFSFAPFIPCFCSRRRGCIFRILLRI